MTVARTSVGTFVSSAAALTVLPGAGAAAGDFGLIIVETANQAAATPTGWTAAGSIGIGTAGAAGATLLSLFVKASIVSADISTGVSIADSGDHQGAIFLTYSGVVSYVRSTGKTQSSASTAASTNALALASYLTTNDIALAILGTDRDSATVSTNASAAWSGVAGANSFPVNVSTATGAGGGIVVNELVPSGNASSVPSFSCTITSSIWNSFLLVLQGANGNANASTLNDNFDDNSLDATKWNTGPLFDGKSAGSCVVAETGGHTEGTPSGTANEYSGRYSVDTLNFDNSYVGITAAGGEATTQETYLSAGADGNNCYMALWSNNNAFLVLRKYTGGANTDRSGVSGGGGGNRWRLRWGQLADDTIYIETAPLTADPPASGDWTVRDSVARDPTISLIAAKVGFGSGCWSAAGSPQLIQFDGFNTATTSGTTYNDTLAASAAAADAVGNAENFAPGVTESAAAADGLNPAGSSFGVPLSESAAAAASPASSQGFVNTLAETSGAADNLGGGLLLSGTLNETAASSDAQTTIVTFGPALSETAVTSATQASQAAFVSPLGESATAGDTLGVGLVLSGSVAENAAASATVTAVQTFAVSLGESGGATDSATVSVTFAPALSETAAAAAALASQAAFASPLSESAAAADAEASAQTDASALGETASAGDSLTSHQTFAATLGETSAAADTENAGATTIYNDVLGESLAPAVSTGVGLVLSPSIGEAAAAADQLAASANVQVGLAATLGAADDVAASATFAAGLGEQAVANDNVDAIVVSIFPPGPVAPARIGRVGGAAKVGPIGGPSRIAPVTDGGRTGTVGAISRVGRVARRA